MLLNWSTVALTNSTRGMVSMGECAGLCTTEVIYKLHNQLVWAILLMAAINLAIFVVSYLNMFDDDKNKYIRGLVICSTIIIMGLLIFVRGP